MTYQDLLLFWYCSRREANRSFSTHFKIVFKAEITESQILQLFSRSKTKEPFIVSTRLITTINTAQVSNNKTVIY